MQVLSAICLRLQGATGSPLAAVAAPRHFWEGNARARANEPLRCERWEGELAHGTASVPNIAHIVQSPIAKILYISTLLRNLLRTAIAINMKNARFMHTEFCKNP